jgi:hypothetical protein
MKNSTEVAKMEDEKMKRIKKITFDQLKKLNETDEKHEYDLIKVLRMMNKGS